MSVRQWRKDMAKDGYVVVQSVLGASTLATLQERFTDKMLSRQPRANFGPAGGFIMVDYRDQHVAELVNLPEARRYWLSLAI
jgi:hypothetical protein